MRHTLGMLLQSSRDICIDDQTASYTGMTDTTTFIKREINNTVSDIFTLIKEYRLQPAAKTLSTSNGTIYYNFPPGLMKAETFTINVGTLVPPLKIVGSQEEWDRLQQFPLRSGFPTHVFPRRDDFGIFPTPQGTYTVTIVGNYQPTRMTVDDYSTGTMATTINDETITITTGAFTSAFVNRWFVLANSSGIPTGNWYRLASYTSAASMELSRTFLEATGTGQTFLIGESPELPEELHQYIPYRVGAIYWGIRRHDMEKAQIYDNFFWTGDFNNTARTGKFRAGVLAVLNDLKTNGRGNSGLIETGRTLPNSNYLRDGIWGITLSE